ncbi:uncharacterized protein CDV56_108733 [Aspergillus thermomutatus]|uniref:BTB domain-containing protein n=1 Tax=Aspergillus thermomutatus TaxID=41047 RepID=A0A397HIV6_ASPTH|nr:uncharacterized protein CDV56_108733 [Aspergillus thermomutatus]RHZ61163.1 hypothetical protein CDV56_108733 [Aspergillus thermomutatus]
MNSGLTRESKHHIAVLEEEDVETFVAFCEYAYTGDYSVPPPGSREDEKDDAIDDTAFKGMFSNPFASTVPPPAPSPPPSLKLPNRDLDVPDRGDSETARNEELTQPQKEGESVKDGNNDVGEDVAAPDDPPQDPASACDEPSEQPLATPAAEEGDPWGFGEDAAPSKGKKSKKTRKDKKKQKGGATAEEPMSNLTPPTTPPPGNPNDQIDNNLTVETTAMLDDPIPVTEHIKVGEVAEVVEVPEPTGADESIDPAAPSLDTESWDRATSVPPKVKDTLNENVKLEHNSQKEDEIKEEVVSPRSQMKAFIDTSFAKQLFPSRRPTGVGLWDKFMSLDYLDHPSTYGTRPLTPVSTHSDSSKSDLPYLVFHAKLYVFAVRYLIPALAQLCLRKLHADLLCLAFPGPKDGEREEERAALTATKARMVLDLLHYTYTKTTRLEPISPTSATQLRDNELRKLVIHYAACKVRELAEYCPTMESMVSSPLASPVDKRPPKADRPSSRGFRALLDSTTELASDLVFRMM